MIKKIRKKAICPECNHKHTVEIEIYRQTRQLATYGVRSRRVTDNQFEYTVTAPQEMVEEIEDEGQVRTIFNDLALGACFAGCTGVVAGGIASALMPAHLPNNIEIEAIAQTIIIWGGIGGMVAYGWLCDEYNTRLKPEWATAKDEAIGGNVELTVDHRYRDGNTEAGRTVNRFGTLPVDVERFNEWAQSALVGKSLAVSNWTPLAKMFTRPEYDQLLAKMTAGGIIVNLGSNKGNNLTGGGRRALTRHLIDCGKTPPSPVGETDFLGERLAQAKASNGGNTPLPRSEVRVGGENGA
jgi:hypothetical protein